MATLAKAPKKDKTLAQILNGLFRIPPASMLARDGSRRHFKVEHRIDKDVYFTMESLIDKTDLDDEITEKARVYEKLGDKVFKKEFRRLYKDAKNTIRGAVRAFRAGFLTDFYVSQGIAPIMAFMPGVDPKRPKKRGLYIVGFYDTGTLVPVLGEIDDITLALELRNAYLKGAVDEYREKQGIAKAALQIPGVNKDLQQRLQRIVAGEVDRQYLIGQIENQATKN